MRNFVRTVLATTLFCGLAVWAAAEDPLMIAPDNLDRKGIVREVTDTFTQLIAAINQKDASAWERFYSRDAFASAVAGGVFFATRNEWVETITANFSARERQQVDVSAVRVIPLASDMALLTSQERTEMQLKDGPSAGFRHAFTMIWKKGPAGWQIVHSHESWVDEPAR